MITPIHPEINVPLAGEDGNAFSILARVRRVMRRAGLPEYEWEAFHEEATSGDYDNLLRTVMLWFAVDDIPTMRTVAERMEYDYEDGEECNPNACYECDNPYAVGGCPECGAGHP